MKSKPIGVRFDLDILERIKKEQNLDTPQAALNWLMINYRPEKPAEPMKPIAMAFKTPAPKIPSGTPLQPPAGLKGIDLTIWKAEQKEKK